ncbi:MAG: hypothetical protein R6X20_03775 [Phycisphaerae bacterium]
MIVFCAGTLAAGEAGPSPAERALAIYTPPDAPSALEWPRQRLIRFMHDLTDFVYEHHVVTDASRPVYGMTYEFWRDGKHIQEFGLDTMHDGAWWASAMVTAHRADPDGPYLERVQTYQVPFYTHMLNHSDRLFPRMRGRGQDTKPLRSPVKGWVPRGWDDGKGFDKSGEPIPPGYHTTSNHLCQDLANLLMDVWLTTRDPALAKGLAHLRAYKSDYFGPIGPVEFGWAVTNRPADALKRFVPSAFTVHGLAPCYSGMYRQEPATLPAYDDGLAWQYREATARAVRGGGMSEDLVLRAAGRAHAATRAMELYVDARPYPYGLYLFDIQRQPAFVAGEGRLDGYLSTSRHLLGGRGVQFAWLAAGVAGHLAAHPDLWERRHREKFPKEPLVRIVDDAPETDGRREGVYDASQPVRGEGVTVTLLADPKNLHVYVESERPEVTVEIRPAGDVREPVPVGRLALRKDGTSSAVNENGEPLLHRAAVFERKPWTGELRVPFGAVPGQPHFINGVEHGRYAVRVNGGEPVTVYMLSEPARIVRRLEALALGTIDTWHGVWKRLGMIPSGWHPDEAKRVRSWELSDAGHVAHVVKTIALVLLHRDGKREWDVMRAQFPTEPRPSRPLPRSVLEAQGLVE